MLFFFSFEAELDSAHSQPSLYLTPVKLQLPLFPGRTNKQPPKIHQPKRTRCPFSALRKNIFASVFLCVFCRGLFFFFFASLLVTPLLPSDSFPSIRPRRRSVCSTPMAVSMTMGRDTKWLTLEVCREFQRGTCSRSDAECKFAHPSRSCHVENGRVIACFDSLKVTTQQRGHPSGPAILHLVCLDTVS